MLTSHIQRISYFFYGLRSSGFFFLYRSIEILKNFSKDLYSVLEQNGFLLGHPVTIVILLCQILLET
jgi:hypothetical protein